MLLSGALLALFMMGFWLYCLTDAILTPASEFRGMPKPAWITVITLTFIGGAVAWLIVREPVRGPASPPARGGPGVQERGVEHPGDEGPGLHRVPAPVPAPGLVGPDGAGDDTEGPDREAEHDGPVGEPVELLDARQPADDPVTRRGPAGRYPPGVPVGPQVDAAEHRGDEEDAGRQRQRGDVDIQPV